MSCDGRNSFLMGQDISTDCEEAPEVRKMYFKGTKSKWYGGCTVRLRGWIATTQVKSCRAPDTDSVKSTSCLLKPFTLWLNTFNSSWEVSHCQRRPAAKWAEQHSCLRRCTATGKEVSKTRQSRAHQNQPRDTYLCVSDRYFDCDIIPQICSDSCDNKKGVWTIT